jgi:hypothetical protein
MRFGPTVIVYYVKAAFPTELSNAGARYLILCIKRYFN